MNVKNLPVAAGLCAAVMLSACATHPLVVGTLYNRLDNRLIDGFEDYADFDAAQEAMLAARIESWHAWHRRTQLPRYAALMAGIGERLAVPEPVARGEVGAWFEEIDGFYTSLDRCSPLADSAGFFATLNDAQVQQIAAHLTARYEEAPDDEPATPAARHARRTERTATWLERFGFSLSAADERLISKYLAQQIDLAPRRRAALIDWSDELVELLERRHEPGVAERIEMHVAGALSVSRRAHPEAYRHNAELWAGLMHALLEQQTEAARRQLAERLTETAGTIFEIAGEASAPALAGAAPTCAHTG